MKKTLRVLFFTVIIIVIVVILKSYIITHTKKNSANRIYSETNLISTTSSDDVYDVILFWGQSNMLGACGYFGAECLYEDSRYAGDNPQYTVEEFSSASGIDKQFLDNSKKMNYVKVYPEKGTIFEYKYSDNTLVDLYTEPRNLGERLAYDKTIGKVVLTTDNYFALQKSWGTNMIP